MKRENLERPRLVKSKLQNKLFLIPSFVTVVASFCGFLAVMSAIRGQYEYAAKAIVLAMLLDGLDGRVARKLNATSEFGKEFDSLSDVIAFGVAPAILVYHWAFVGSADEFGLLVSFIFLVCGAVRLARFNVRATAEPKSYFEGLPIPGAAFAIVSLVYASPQQVESTTFTAFLLLYTGFLSLMMVSMLPFYSVKRLKVSQENTMIGLVLLAAAVALTWYHSKLIFLLVANGYALSGGISWLYRRFRTKHSNTFESQFSDQ